MPVSPVGVHRLNGVSRNRVIDRAVKANKGRWRISTGWWRRRGVRLESHWVVAKLPLTGPIPKILAVVRRVGESEMVKALTRSELGVQSIRRTPMVAQPELQKAWNNLIFEAGVAGIRYLP